MRDTDTMDTFVDSVLVLPAISVERRRDAAFDPQRTADWLPVDEYIGGVEHAILHLLYSRFVTKALVRHGLGRLHRAVHAA